jgi:hypothetical protein
MITLYRRLNYRNIELSINTIGEQVGVLRRDGSVRMVRWLGFIDRSEARALPGAVPVKLVVARVVENGDTAVDVPRGSYVKGCWIESGAFAVIAKTIQIIE